MNIELQPLILMTIQGFILLMAGWVGTSVRGVYQELRLLNGRLISLESWKQAHERDVDARQASLEERITLLHEDLRTWRK